MIGIEKYLDQYYKNNTSFKDVTLYFENLDGNLTEDKLKKKCEKILGNKVIEVSLVYKINKYIELQKIHHKL